LQAGSNGILETIESANALYKDVKQTSDATIDSRLLVSAADLSYKKASQSAIGNATAAIDVDEFVSKCISFMQRGPAEEAEVPVNSTQQCGARLSGREGDDGEPGEDGDEGDPLDWEWLGRAACLPKNSRPALSGFLLGPLSVQKRVRQMTQRRARQERIDPTQAVRPNELQDEDLSTQETANLTQLCKSIRETLFEYQTVAESRAEAEMKSIGRENLTLDEAKDIMDRHGIADTGGIPLFRFCINPNSFGQTIENLFYVSFLIRDGFVGVHEDSDQLPTLRKSQNQPFTLPIFESPIPYARELLVRDSNIHRSIVCSDPHAPHEAQAKGIQKYQAVFSLDFETWEDLIDVYDIKTPMIKARDEEDAQARKGATAFWS
jgi:hypothetical protein